MIAATRNSALPDRSKHAQIMRGARQAVGDQMIFGIRLSATLAACLIGLVSFSGAAVAGNVDTSMDSPAMQALITPELLKARAAFQAGNFHGAVQSLRVAIQHGNPLARVMLSKMYFEGRGVPKNYVESLKLLELLTAHDEPGQTLAMDEFDYMKKKLNETGTAQEKSSMYAAMTIELLRNPYVRQFLKNYADNMANSRIVLCGPLGCW